MLVGIVAGIGVGTVLTRSFSLSFAVMVLVLEAMLLCNMIILANNDSEICPVSHTFAHP